MSAEAQDLYLRTIWPALVAGEEPVVGVCRVEARFVVRWGAGGALLETDEAGALSFAETLEGAGLLASLADLLRFAAEVCAAKNAKVRLH